MDALTRFVQYPWAVALVVLLPIIGALVLGAERRSRGRRLARLGTRSMLTLLAPAGARLGPWRTARILTAMGLAGFAFAGPRWGVGRTVTRASGADVVLALDASLSMMATDAPPSRLEAMKNVVRQLRSASPNDRFAMTAFAGHSYVRSPLTTDGGALDLYLNDLNPQTVGVAGTSVASALKQATTLLSDKKTDRQRVIVLMSDGEGFEPLADLTAEAKRAGDAGITVVTVGFGTTKGSTIPVTDSTGRVVDKKGPDGQVVVSQYSPTLLQTAAKGAGHSSVFIPAEVPDKAARIRQVLNKLQSNTKGVVAPEELALKFQWFVGLALGLLLLDTIIILRPRRRKLPTRTNGVTNSKPALKTSKSGKQAAAAAAVAAIVVSLGACDSPSRSTAPAAAKPVVDTTLKATYNRGTKLLPTGPLPAAAVILDSAARATKDTAVRANALYNGGWASLVRGMSLKREPSTLGGPKLVRGPAPKTKADSMAAAQALADALVRYRVALKMHPDDDDARWNYELALRNGAGGGKGNNKPNKKGQPKKQNKQNKNGKPKKADKKKPPQPRIEKIHVDPQQAEQLLDAAAQHENKALKTAPPQKGNPPQGKDW